MSNVSCQRVLVAGAGTMGRQISFQCALYGRDVTVFDIDKPGLEAAVEEQRYGVQLFESRLGITSEQAAAALARIEFTDDPARGGEADLLIEAVPENVKVKRSVFTRFHEICPPPAIFVSTTSSFVPSQIADATGRPERFAAAHFNDIITSNVVEIMPHPGTATEVLETIIAFCRETGQLPIVCQREHAGFVVNNMIMAMSHAALTLAERGVATVKDIDRAWMKTLNVDVGPFGRQDFSGLDVCWQITQYMASISKDEQTQRNADFLKQYVDRGEVGCKVGQGFYTYPDPEYFDPSFLKVTSDCPKPILPVPDPLASAASCGPVSRPAHPQPSIAAPPSASAPGQVMRRFVMRMVEEPLASDAPLGSPFCGPAVIVGQNDSARALGEKLASLGVRVHHLPVDEGAESSLAALDRLWQQGPAPHLFLMTALDHDAAPALYDVAGWRKRKTAGILIPFLVGRSWFDRMRLAENPQQATIATATAMGGDFGLSGQCPAIEGGAMTGLVKAIDIETLGKLNIKAIDVSPTATPQFVAEAICCELAARRPDVEVGFIDGRRHVVRAVPQHAASLPRRTVRRDGVWVVSGGARGVTAVVAREFARRHGLRLHLLGTSPAPQIDPAHAELSPAELETLKQQTMADAARAGRSPDDEWARHEKAIHLERSLRSFAEAGVQATYHQCDVADRGRLESVLDVIRRSDGPINGVLHGAGAESGCRYHKKDLPMVDRVLAPKIEGTVNLMELTWNDPVELFVGFGSTSGRFGGMGNTDYSLANDLLSKMINRYRRVRPDCAAFSFHWTAWGDVGMATRPSAQLALKMMKVELMPVLEGAQHTIAEIEAAGDDTEILITDHPNGVHSDHITMPRA